MDDLEVVGVKELKVDGDGGSECSDESQRGDDVEKRVSLGDGDNEAHVEKDEVIESCRHICDFSQHCCEY